MIDQIRGLEDLKSLACARQAETTVAFDLSQRRDQADAGVPAVEQGAGVAAQIALARRESPAKGSRLLGLAKTLTGMPHTFAAFRTGLLNEWRVTLIVKETICLTPEDRAGVDEELAPDTGTLNGTGDKAIIAAVRAAAYRRDPASVAKRAARAVTERGESLRPAPDTMTYLTALLPAAQGVAAYAALVRDADTTRAAGDDRSRGQVMADTLVERLTGTPGGLTGVEIQLVMTDRTLFQADAEPARLPGYGTIPAERARTIAFTRGGGNDLTGAHDLALWVRRLYTAPGSGELVAMDSKARLFPAGLKRLLQVRDDTCRTPVLRRPHQAPRPHHLLAQRRTHHEQQRPRPLRSLQPHQRNTRLDRQNYPRPTPHRRNHHPHRPHLPLHSPTTRRHRTSGRRRAVRQRAAAGPRGMPAASGRVQTRAR